jgi:diguanylate cyclase (GGDEF)-like protein/PAS domain S-box-containing protein
MAPPRWRNPRLAAGLMVANLLVAAALGLLVTLAARSSRMAYETRARETAANMVAAAQSNIASELARVDSVLQAAIGELDARRDAGPPGPPTVDHILLRHHELLPGVEGVRLTDAQGKVRWGNDLPAGDAVDVSDRDYFARAQAGRGTSAVLSGPLKSRASGHWVLVLARPVIVSGRFDGVLYASIAHDQFEAIFARVDLGPRDAVTLRTSDLRLVARHAPSSAAPSPIGSTEVSPQFAAALRADASHGTYVSRTALDGIDRINAFRRVDGWPLVVIAGLETQRFFEPWHTQVRQSSLLALVAWMLVAAATLAMYRAWSRDAQLLRQLASETHRTQELLRVAADGIHILDRTGHLVMLSDSFAQMLGSTPQKMLGRHVSSWDATQTREQLDHWFANIRSGHRQRVEIRHRRDDGSLIDVELQVSAAEIEGELLVFASTRDITAMKAAQARIEHIAFHDPLTQLPNRLLLQDRLRQAVLSAQRTGSFVAVCYLDLDGFKRVNDEHGHDAGDALLVEIAHRLQLAMRGQDTAARLGGDEFVLVLTMLDDPEGWRTIIGRAMAAIRAPVAIDGAGAVRVGVSAGVALAPRDGVDAEVLLGKADRAMLQAKRDGKNRVQEWQ